MLVEDLISDFDSRFVTLVHLLRALEAAKQTDPREGISAYLARLRPFLELACIDPPRQLNDFSRQQYECVAKIAAHLDFQWTPLLQPIPWPDTASGRRDSTLDVLIHANLPLSGEPSTYAEALARALATDWRDQTVALVDLAVKWHEVHSVLKHKVTASGRYKPSVERLDADCRAIITQHAPKGVTFGRARLLALLLASDPEILAPKRQLRELAALITLLQRRRTGLAPVREVVLLTREGAAIVADSHGRPSK
jgi:hypothetical protein